MAKSRFHILLEQDIQTLIHDRSEDLASGKVHSFDSYQFAVGYIKGLRDAMKLADAIEGEEDGSRNAA